MLLHDDADLRTLLANTHSIGVLGGKANPAEPAFYVPAYLTQHGYSCVAVNPTLAGRTVFGNPAVASLAELTPVDLIEVFRRPDLIDAHVDELAALPWRPRYVWFQLGIRNDPAAARLVAMGIGVVQDRCMMPEHRRLVG